MDFVLTKRFRNAVDLVNSIDFNNIDFNDSFVHSEDYYVIYYAIEKYLDAIDLNEDAGVNSRDAIIRSLDFVSNETLEQFFSFLMWSFKIEDSSSLGSSTQKYPMALTRWACIMKTHVEECFNVLIGSLENCLQDFEFLLDEYPFDLVFDWFSKVDYRCDDLRECLAVNNLVDAYLNCEHFLLHEAYPMDLLRRDFYSKLPKIYQMEIVL